MYTGTLIEHLIATVESLERKGRQQDALDSRKSGQSGRMPMQAQQYRDHAVA